MHALRHTYVSTLANAGTDAFRLQKVMGHKSIVTTQGYIKVSMSALEGLADVMEIRNSECARTHAQNWTQMDTVGEENSMKSIGINDQKKLLIRRSQVRALVEEPLLEPLSEIPPSKIVCPKPLKCVQNFKKRHL
jgi:hypothetical protein